MSYKIVFRAHQREGGDHPITWEPGCPLLFETIQIARSVETGKAFLQAKLLNLTAGEIGSYHARFTVAYRDGSTQSFDVEPLDADMAPGGSHQITPLALENGDALYAEGAVLSVRAAEGDWESSEAPNPLPEPLPLKLSATALGERRVQLLSSSSMASDDAENALREGDGYWICPCGWPNKGTELCGACGASLEKLRGLEDEQELERMAAERAAREKERAEEKAAQNAKLKKIAIIAGAVAVVVVVAIALFITVFLPSAVVNEAKKLASNGQFEEAISLLEENDASDEIPEIIRMEADAAISSGDFEGAIRLYESIDDEGMVTDAKKQWAETSYESGSYDEALELYQELSDDEGVFNCAMAFVESGDFEKAVDSLTPLAEKGVDGAQDALNEAMYGYVLQNNNNEDESTCEYLILLKDAGYKDSAELFANLYSLSATPGELKNRPIRQYNNLEYLYTVNGIMPGGLDERTLSVFCSASDDVQTVQLKYFEPGQKLACSFSERIDGGAHSATIEVVDDSTGKTLLEETVSF